MSRSSPDPGLSGCLTGIVGTAAALIMAAILHSLIGTPWAPNGPAGTVVRTWPAEQRTEPGRLSQRIQVRPFDGSELAIIRATTAEAGACPAGSLYPDCLKEIK